MRHLMAACLTQCSLPLPDALERRAMVVPDKAHRSAVSQDIVAFAWNAWLRLLKIYRRLHARDESSAAAMPAVALGLVCASFQSFLRQIFAERGPIVTS